MGNTHKSIPIQVKHGLENRLSAGQGQNIMLVVQCMHNNLLQRLFLMGNTHKIISISEDQWRKFKLNTTSWAGYTEVMAKTK